MRNWSVTSTSNYFTINCVINLLLGSEVCIKNNVPTHINKNKITIDILLNNLETTELYS